MTEEEHKTNTEEFISLSKTSKRLGLKSIACFIGMALSSIISIVLIMYDRFSQATYLSIVAIAFMINHQFLIIPKWHETIIEMKKKTDELEKSIKNVR